MKSTCRHCGRGKRTSTLSPKLRRPCIAIDLTPAQPACPRPGTASVRRDAGLATGAVRRERGAGSRRQGTPRRHASTGRTIRNASATPIIAAKSNAGITLAARCIWTILPVLKAMSSCLVRALCAGSWAFSSRRAPQMLGWITDRVKGKKDEENVGEKTSDDRVVPKLNLHATSGGESATVRPATALRPRTGANPSIHYALHIVRAHAHMTCMRTNDHYRCPCAYYFLRLLAKQQQKEERARAQSSAAVHRLPTRGPSLLRRRSQVFNHNRRALSWKVE